MLELHLMLAKVMPENILLKELTTALEDYRIYGTEKTHSKLKAIIGLLALRYVNEDKSVDESLKEVRRMEDWMKVMPKDQ